MNHAISLQKIPLLKAVERLQSLTDLDVLRKGVRRLSRTIRTTSSNRKRSADSNVVLISKPFLVGELEQIHAVQSVERARYYLSRLKKALTTEKITKVNDLNLRRWKEYEDVLTDSLWILPRRDNSGEHSAWYWGNFIPQIPHQLMTRYTKKGEWVFDPFAGSGTTLLECQRLKRNALGIELNRAVAKRTRHALNHNTVRSDTTAEIEVGDSTRLDVHKSLRRLGVSSVQLVVLHPPYHDIIRFSRDSHDLSNAPTTKQFLTMFGKVVDRSLSVLDKGRYMALVIGDKYQRGEWVPLGFLAMNEVTKRRCTLKSIVVKNFERTLGKRKQAALWRYRALIGGFYVFKHEYIFIF
ncbi:MAG TPA: DNA methyltransferase, partial [Bacteroidota bacterium]